MAAGERRLRTLGQLSGLRAMQQDGANKIFKDQTASRTSSQSEQTRFNSLR